MKEIPDSVLDVVRTAIEELTGAVLLQTFKSSYASAEYEAIDGLDKLFLELLQLNFLLGPRPGVG